jgi:sulfite exporter TauE/SafE
MSLAVSVSILAVLFVLKFFPTVESTIASNRIYRIITLKLSPFIMARNNHASFFNGVLNGTLPCGLVYMPLQVPLWCVIRLKAQKNRAFYAVLLNDISHFML